MAIETTITLAVALGVWVLFAYGAATIAKEKGHDFVTWFVAGLFIGVFALLFAAVAKPNQRLLERRKVKSGTHKKCPLCAEIIRREAKVCRYCGRDL